LDIFKPPQLIFKPPKIGGLKYELGGLKEKKLVFSKPIQPPPSFKKRFAPMAMAISNVPGFCQFFVQKFCLTMANITRGYVYRIMVVYIKKIFQD